MNVQRYVPRLILFCVALIVFMGMTQAYAENKLAFVVGINSYAHFGPEAQLQRAVQDANTVADTLQTLNFKVDRIVNRDDTINDSFLRRFNVFLREIQPGDTVIFYYSGHGVGLHGNNYLLPSDIPDMSDGDEYVLRAHAISEEDIVSRVKARGARVAILVIDACRNDPFSADGQKSLNLSKGLERVDLAEGTMSIYAAGYGQKAFDRLSDTTDPSPNSVFTRVFAAELKRPNTNLVDLAENVRDEVAALARSANLEQVPAVNNQLLGARSVFLAGRESAPQDQTIATPLPSVPVSPPVPAVDFKPAAARELPANPTPGLQSPIHSSATPTASLQPAAATVATPPAGEGSTLSSSRLLKPPPHNPSHVGNYKKALGHSPSPKKVATIERPSIVERPLVEPRPPSDRPKKPTLPSDLPYRSVKAPVSRVVRTPSNAEPVPAPRAEAECDWICMSLRKGHVNNWGQGMQVH